MVSLHLLWVRWRGRLTGKLPKVVAHRGRFGQSYENVIPGLATLAGKTDAVEVDVRVTRDNVPVLIHDRSTGRIAEEDLRVRGSTYDELSRLKVYQEFRIPRLQDFLLECSRQGIRTVFLDIKVMKKKALSSVIEIAIEYRDSLEIYALSKKISVLEHIKQRANGVLKTGVLRISNDNMHELLTRKNARYVDQAFVKNTDEGYSNNRAVIRHVKDKGLDYSASLINEIERDDMAVKDGCQFVLTDRADAFGQKFRFIGYPNMKDSID